MILHFILKLFELFKEFCFVPHEIDIVVSTQVIGKGNKVLKAPLGVEFIGPHTYVCTRPNSSLALSLCPTKGALVIFPSRHDSHVSIDS
jgi:hypothetical protein